MTPDAQTQAEFRALVRSWTPEQANDFLKRIDEQERGVHDLAREIIWQEHPGIAPAVRPVDLDAQYRREQIERTADEVERLRLLIKQAEANAASLAALQAPHYTPVFYEPAGSGYTPFQRAMQIAVPGALGVWIALRLYGPAIEAFLAAVFAAVVTGLMWACAAGGAMLLLVILFKREKPSAAPLDAPIAGNQYTIIQTVVINETQKTGSA